jgi:hypothetical protein
MIGVLWKNDWMLDLKATWHPFRETSCHIKAIKKSDKMPTGMFTCSLYFRGPSGIKATGTKVYTTILVGHKMESCNISEPIWKWAITKHHYFTESNAQAEFVITVAWGFTSLAGLDCGELARKMMEHTCFRFQLGCQDHDIN